MSLIEKVLFALGAAVFILLAFLAVIGYRRLKNHALGRITYKREFSTDGVFVGESLELTETVRNPSWFHFMRLRIDFYVPGGLTIDGVECKEHTKLTSIFMVPPFSTVVKKHIVRADKRSHYELHDAGIKYRRFDYIFESDVDFYAYPDYFELHNSYMPDIHITGDSVSGKKFIEDPFFISGIREYRSGDPMNAINFKVSARSFSGGVRRLMCNSYDSSRKYDSIIFLDLYAYHGIFTSSEEQVEASLRCACYLFCEAVGNGGRIGFAANRSNGKSSYIYIPCGSGEEHTKRILREFAELNMYSKRFFSISALIDRLSTSIPSGTDIYLITPFVDEKTAETLYFLERSGCNVQVIKIGRM